MWCCKVSTKIQAAAIEFNTMHDREAPVVELQGMARFDAGDDVYCTPVSGDALTKVRKLGDTWAHVLMKGWEEQR